MPTAIARIVQEELAAAEARILARIAALLGEATGEPARGGVRVPAGKRAGRGAPGAGKRFQGRVRTPRFGADEKAALEARVLGLFRKGLELKLADVRAKLPGIDRKRLGRAVDALVGRKALRHLGGVTRSARYALPR